MAFLKSLRVLVQGKYNHNNWVRVLPEHTVTEGLVEGVLFYEVRGWGVASLYQKILTNVKVQDVGTLRCQLNITYN